MARTVPACRRQGAGLFGRHPDGGATTYTYDAIHWRAKKQTGASGKLYWYDVNTGEVLMETALDGSAPREFVYFAGQRVARRNPDGTVNYRFLDHLGSLRVMTDSQGTIVQELDYDPFGYSIPLVSNPSTDDPYQFISKERDAESLNDHYWFRQYSPRLARWCSADPLGGSVFAPQSLNRYSYVLNDPVNLVDPLGLCIFWCVLTDDHLGNTSVHCEQEGCYSLAGGGPAPLLNGDEGGPGGGGGSPDAPGLQIPVKPGPCSLGDTACCQRVVKNPCMQQANDDFRQCERGASRTGVAGGLIVGIAIGALSRRPGVSVVAGLAGGIGIHHYESSRCYANRTADTSKCESDFDLCMAGLGRK